MVAVLDKVDIRDARENESLVDSFFEQQKGLAFKVAHKYKNSKVEFEDILGLAYFGLLKAFNTFDLESGLQFSTYAFRVMMNEVGMELRRSYYKTDFISMEHELNPHDDNPVSFHDLLPAPEEDLKWEDFQALNDVLDVFELRFQNEPRMIKALKMYVLEDKTTKEIAEEFGVGQPQGSKIASRAVKEFQQIAIEMDVIDGFNKYYKRAKSGDVKKAEVKENKFKAKVLYAIKFYPQLKSNEIAEILGYSAQKIGIMITDLKRGKKFKFDPDYSVKPIIENYLSRKEMI